MKYRRDFHDALETACEAALQSGFAGVLVTHRPGMAYTIEVSATVPYGQIYEITPPPLTHDQETP